MTGHLLAASPPPSPSPRSSPRRPTHMQRLHPPRRTPTRHSIRNRIRILAAVTPRRRATRIDAAATVPVGRCQSSCQFSCQLNCAMRMPCACMAVRSLCTLLHVALHPALRPVPVRVSRISVPLFPCLSLLHLSHDTCRVCAGSPPSRLASRRVGLGLSSPLDHSFSVT